MAMACSMGMKSPTARIQTIRAAFREPCAGTQQVGVARSRATPPRRFPDPDTPSDHEPRADEPDRQDEEDGAGRSRPPDDPDEGGEDHQRGETQQIPVGERGGEVARCVARRPCRAAARAAIRRGSGALRVQAGGGSRRLTDG